YVRLGDAAMAKGDIKTADRFYGRAVGKDQSRADWIVKWRDARRQLVPETQSAFGEDYVMYVGILRTLAVTKRTDVEAHRDYLTLLLEQTTLGGGGRNDWARLVTEADASLRYFEPEQPPALRRFRGIAGA